MPELPEVERFRELLLPLVSEKDKLEISITSSRPSSSEKFPRYAIEFPFRDEVKNNPDLGNNKCPMFLHAIERKGKLICMHLNHGEGRNAICSGCGISSSKIRNSKRFMFIHFGMTGRICTESSLVQLESSSKNTPEEFPPRHTHVVFNAGQYRAYLSDPRKFGRLNVNNTREAFDKLAPDALGKKYGVCESLKKLVGQGKSIKALLLDQNYAVSGIGNWVADELLFQTKIHPDQLYLSKEEVETINIKLQTILYKAITCQSKEQSYPEEWIFHRRWRKVSGGVSDLEFGKVTFISSANRTTAIVASEQKKKHRKPIKDDSESEGENHVLNKKSKRVKTK